MINLLAQVPPSPFIWPSVWPTETTFHHFYPHINDASNPFIWFVIIIVPICLGIGAIVLVAQILHLLFRR